jgi:hypothetical protein
MPLPWHAASQTYTQALVPPNLRYWARRGRTGRANLLTADGFGKQSIASSISAGLIPPLTETALSSLPQAMPAHVGDRARLAATTGQHSTIKADVAVVDHQAEAFLEGESYRSVAKAQARAILRPQEADKMSENSGQAGQLADQSACVSEKSGHIDFVEVTA